jgi:hypothetical protein
VVQNIAHATSKWERAPFSEATESSILPLTCRKRLLNRLAEMGSPSLPTEIRSLIVIRCGLYEKDYNCKFIKS